LKDQKKDRKKRVEIPFLRYIVMILRLFQAFSCFERKEDTLTEQHKKYQKIEILLNIVFYSELFTIDKMLEML
jgi:hypothetical protein